MTVAIINYGVGNVGSLVNMLERKCGVHCEVVDGGAALKKGISHCILPGVGHFGFAAEELRTRRVQNQLDAFLKTGGHLLGICLGAQLLLEFSEEGDACGLGFISGQVRKFQKGQLNEGERVPHMGWCEVALRRKLAEREETDTKRFYFVHSYHMVPEKQEDVYMTADFAGGFTAAVKRGNVTGVQFHPEKSHAFGIAFLKSWLSGS